MPIPTEIKFVWEDIELSYSDSIINNLRRIHLLKPFLWKGYEWDHAWEVKSHLRKKLKNSEFGNGVKVETLLSDPDTDINATYIEADDERCSVSSGMPKPDQVTMTWRNRADDDLIDPIRARDLTGVLTWPSYEHKLCWDVISYSCKITIDKDTEEEIFEIKTTVEQI